MEISYIQEKVHKLAMDNGWWENADIKIVPEKLALIHSEISEALEEYRSGIALDSVYYQLPDDTKSKPEGFGIELADAVIRIMDLCGYLGIDLAELIRIKHEYNGHRSYRHGGKLA